MLPNIKNMRKLMVKFLRKFENRGIKIARVNSILITKSINLQFFTLIMYGVGIRCDRRRFSVHSAFIQKSMHQVIVHDFFLFLYETNIYWRFKTKHAI